MKKTALFFTLVLLLASSMFVSVAEVRAADPALSISPSSTAVYEGQTFDVTVELTSDNNPHSQSDVELQFDPAVLQVDGVTQGSLYSNFSNESIDNTGGTVSFQADFFGGSDTGSGTVATVTFSTVAAGSDTLAFTTNTQILDDTSVAYGSSVFTSGAVTVNTALADAVITMSSDFTDWAVGDQQEIIVSVDSQGNNLAGVDLVLTYDPAVFTFNSASWKDLFPNQQGFSNDTTNGIVTISGVSDQSNPFNGSGEMVGFFFEGAAIGSGSFDFDWTLGSTTDTNIVDMDNQNTDLLTTDPAAIAINVVNSATLSFEFSLLDFLGDITTKSGTILVSGPDITTAFSSPSALGVITDLALGTFTYGSAYDLVLRVPGYLATKQNQLISAGVNPSTGNLDFGALTPGDVNQDDVNNTFDLFEIFNNWNTTGSVTTDLNGDQKVNSFDVGLLYAYFNQSASL